jgi:hypothetical protein
MGVLDDALALAGIGVEIVVGPARVGAVDDHLRRADRGADVEALQQAPGDDGADVRILRGDDEAPERAVDAEAAPIAVEKLLRVLGERLPVAVQHLGIDEALQFEIARLLEQPVAVDFETGKGHGGANDRKRGHEYAPVIFETWDGRKGTAERAAGSMHPFCVGGITDGAITRLRSVRAALCPCPQNLRKPGLS